MVSDCHASGKPRYAVPLAGEACLTINLPGGRDRRLLCRYGELTAPAYGATLELSRRGPGDDTYL